MRVKRLSSVRSGGKWGVVSTPVGDAVIGFSGDGIFWLSFGSEQSAIDEMHDFWKSPLTRDDKGAQQTAGKIFTKGGGVPVDLLVEGTPFQIKAWEALLTVPFGVCISYGKLAAKAGCPKASRAIGTAIGKNNISYLIPCHRIVRSDNSVGNYRWGSQVKKDLLKWESEK